MDNLEHKSIQATMQVPVTTTDDVSTVEPKNLLQGDLQSPTKHSNSTPLISDQHPSGVYNNLRLDGNQRNRKLIPNVGDRRYTGVGTLLVTNMNGQPCIVLGREAFKSIKHRGAYMVSIFEEFGGGIQRRRATLADNACFELREETSNLLDLTECSQILEDKGMHFDLPFRDDRIYRLYVINIPEAHNIIPYLQVNRQIITRALNHPAKGTKSKIKTFLEMDTIKLVPLVSIQRAMMDINNYVCFKAEDTIWNLSTPTPNYRGILNLSTP